MGESMLEVLSKEDTVQIALGIKIQCARCKKVIEKSKSVYLSKPRAWLRPGARGVCSYCAMLLTTSSIGPRP